MLLSIIHNNDFFLSQKKFLGQFRYWLINQRELFVYHKKPIWVLLIKSKQWLSLNELLSTSDKNKIIINYKDNNGRGWLHYAIYYSMPNILAIKGLYLLDSTWNNRDHYLNSPLFIYPSSELANEMMKRLWIEQTHNKKQIYEILKKLVIEAKQAKKYDLYRIWLFWLNQYNI